MRRKSGPQTGLADPAPYPLRGYRERAPVIPKIKEFAELTLDDGVVLKGYVFVDATARIQDLLNDPTPFFPFIDETDNIHLINKSVIVRARPYD